MSFKPYEQAIFEREEAARARQRAREAEYARAFVPSVPSFEEEAARIRQQAFEREEAARARQRALEAEEPRRRTSEEDALRQVEAFEREEAARAREAEYATQRRRTRSEEDALHQVEAFEREEAARARAYEADRLRANSARRAEVARTVDIHKHFKKINIEALNEILESQYLDPMEFSIRNLYEEVYAMQELTRKRLELGPIFTRLQQYYDLGLISPEQGWTRPLLNAICLSLRYARRQSPEFQSLYLDRFYDECVTADDPGSADPLSCSKGMLERFVTALILPCKFNPDPVNDAIYSVVSAEHLDVNALVQRWMTEYKRTHYHTLGDTPARRIELLRGYLRRHGVDQVPSWFDGKDATFDGWLDGGGKYKRKTRIKKQNKKLKQKTKHRFRKI